LNEKDMSEQTLSEEQLLARTMYLLSRAATMPNRCPRRIRALIQHLECVALHTHLDQSIRDMSGQLAEEWRSHLHALGSETSVFH
jgi:hypothetical protein